MKVLMITHYFEPKLGGVEKVVKEICNELSDYNITVITSKHQDSLKNVEEFNKWTKIYRFNYVNKKYVGLFSIWKWLFLHRKLIKDADVIHIHDVFVWYLPFRFIYPVKKVYITFHGWEGKYPISKISILQKKIAYYLTSGNICAGKFIEEIYGIRSNFITYGGSKVSVNNKKKDKDTFIYIGRLSADNGIPIIIEVLKQLKGIDMHFIGDGPLKNLCSKYGVVHGFVKNTEKYLSNAQYCFAGGYLSILDSFANGCFVFTCYENKVRKMYLNLTPFKNYMVIADSPVKLLNKIKYYQSNSNERRKKISKAYNFVKNQNWSVVADQYRKLWQLH